MIVSRKRIIPDFLYKHGENYFTRAPATYRENQPRCTPVDARNDGLNTRITMIKIVPDKISYFVSMEEKPAKYIWEVE